MIMVQVLAAFVAVFTIAMVQGVPKKFLFWCGINSAVSWLIYMICQDAGMSIAFSTLISTLAVALISHIFARIFKSPVTVFLIPGILPLVPGVNTYRIVYYLIQEDSVKSSYYFNLTLQIAGMIAIGIFIIDTIFKIISSIARNKRIQILQQLIRLHEEKRAISEINEQEIIEKARILNEEIARRNEENYIPKD
ncbi:MAG: threonine/serine exporter family protein [Clostridiales bacterium]|nr:threonine/serine exporter family protein [Clostridiales bacterium]